MEMRIYHCLTFDCMLSGNAYGIPDVYVEDVRCFGNYTDLHKIQCIA